MLFQQIDQLIRLGAFDRALNLLKTAAKTKDLGPLELASFYRRLGYSQLALSQLRPELFLQNSLKPKPNPKYVIEYASNLTMLGLTEEAAFHLKRIPPEKSYAYFFSLGVLLVRQGKFDLAKGAFQNARLAEDATPYETLIARSNELNALLGCFLYEEVLAQGTALIEALKKDQNRNLLAWCYSCVAQAHDFLRNHDAFLKNLKLSLDLYQLSIDQEIKTAFQVNQLKWLPIGNLLCGIKTHLHEDLKTLHDFRDRAFAYRDWEGYRDLVVFIAYFEQNAQTLRNVFHGSPHAFQKNRIHKWREELEKIGFELDLAPVHSFSSELIAYQAAQQSKRLSELESKFPRTPDLLSKAHELNLAKGSRNLKPGQIPHRMLLALLTDWYKPLRLYELHDLVFGKSELFHPIHSPNRIHQGVRRLKTFLKKERIPIEIHSHFDFYFLKFKKPVQIELPVRTSAFLNQWKAHIESRLVSTAEASKLMRLNPRSIQLKIKEHASHFEETREGRNRRYRLKTSD